MKIFTYIIIMAALIVFIGCGSSPTPPPSGGQPAPPPPPPSRGQPAITIDTPAPGAIQLSGNTLNVDVKTIKVVIYVLTNEWYVQPLVDAPFTNINPDGSWTSSTNPWSSIVALLVNPDDYTPMATEITNPALDPNVLVWTVYPPGPISVKFSGYTWGIKTTGNVAGDEFDPGPNFWSNDPSGQCRRRRSALEGHADQWYVAVR